MPCVHRRNHNPSRKDEAGPIICMGTSHFECPTFVETGKRKGYRPPLKGALEKLVWKKTPQETNWITSTGLASGQKFGQFARNYNSQKIRNCIWCATPSFPSNGRSGSTNWGGCTTSDVSAVGNWSSQMVFDTNVVLLMVWDKGLQALLAN